MTPLECVDIPSSADSGLFRTEWFRFLSPNIDVAAFLFFLVLLEATSAAALLLALPGVPLSYLELFFLAPILHRRVGRCLMSLSVLIAAARVIEGIFGFDQMFIAVYMLIHNLPGFPLRFLLSTAFAAAISVICLVVIAIRLPVRMLRVTFGWTLLAVVLISGGEVLKRHTKANLIGTSFGYLYGQASFSQMLWGNYKIPLWTADPYPGTVGARAALQSDSNYFLIVVESLGDPSSPALEQYLFSGFHDPRITSSYQILKGRIPARGSTIHGELRELCGGILSKGLMGTGQDSCLPGLLDQHGYSTTAVHANRAGMYGRDEWYPRIGFRHYINSDTHVLPVGNVSSWWGTLLDPDALQWITTHYFQGRRRQFVYWMTISTHVPTRLLPGATIPPGCQQIGDLEGCTHLANLKYVLNAVSTASQGLKGTTVVIVGDHPPPFASPASRQMFKADTVPYLVLTPDLNRKEFRDIAVSE